MLYLIKYIHFQFKKKLNIYKLFVYSDKYKKNGATLAAAHFQMDLEQTYRQSNSNMYLDLSLKCRRPYHSMQKEYPLLLVYCHSQQIDCTEAQDQNAP